MRYLLLLFMLSFSLLQARTYEVSGGGSKLQEAINSVSDGDSIIVTDNKEYGQVKIYKKVFKNSGLVIVSKTYLDNVVNGNDRFAPDMPRIKYQDKEHTRPHNNDDAISTEKTDEGFALTEEYSTNGALRILESSNITVEGFNIDGGGVWQKYYSVWGGAQLFGNNAIAIFNSGETQIRGCRIHHAYRGIHIKDRNVQGIFAEPNKDDIDKDNFSPAANPLSMGDHLIEQNLIYENHWGMFFEILWDAASTIRNNLIVNNGVKNKDYVVTSGNDNERDGVKKINWLLWSGGGVKIHGVDYVPLIFENNTFYKNLIEFNSHWKDGGPNFRFYDNIFARSDDSYWDMLKNEKSVDANYENLGDNLFKRYDSFVKKYVGLSEFGTNTIAKHWSGSNDLGYVPLAEFDGNKKPSGGEELSRFGISQKAPDGYDNKYLGLSSDETFKNSDDRFSPDYLVPKDNIPEIKDRGYMSKGQYDLDGSKADAGAIDVNGNWAGTGSPLVIYDRDRYAVVDFFDDNNGNKTSAVDIRFRMKFKGGDVDKIEYVVQSYYAGVNSKGQLPAKHDIDFQESSISKDEIKSQLSKGQMVEVRYFGLSPEFNKSTTSKYARYMLQVKITSGGKEYYSNVGYFDYQKVPMEFKISLTDVNDDNSKGDDWSYGDKVIVYQPFWMSIRTVDDKGDPVDMEKYNGTDAIVLKTESPSLWESLWRWNSGDPVDKNAKPGKDDRWVKMDANNDGNYLNDGWGSDGKYEGIFTFSKPSIGDEYLRANLKGADAFKGSLSGTSVGFRVISVPDSIQYVDMPISYNKDGQPSLSPGVGTVTSINLVVKDVDGNLLTGQKITIKVDSNIGSFIDDNGNEVVDVELITGLDGVARIQFKSTDKKGETGYITATAENPNKKVEAKLDVGLIYVDNTPPKPRPNVGYRGNFNTKINPEGTFSSDDINNINKVLDEQNGNPKTTKLMVLDFKVHAKDFPVGSKFKIRALVTNAQGNVVAEIIPNIGGKVGDVLVAKDPEETGGKLQLGVSEFAKFSGSGEVESIKGGSDFRVAVPWNHVNENGRIVEAGVFILLFYVEDPNGNVDKTQTFYIVK